MKLIIALLMLSLCLPAALASGNGSESVEAITSISLPVDSVTIYPEGLISVKRIGSLDVTEGQHKFVLDVPELADVDTVLLAVTNATKERVVYQGDPVYTLNVSSTGLQKFVMSYLMYAAGYWEPRYDLHLKSDSILISANAIVENKGGEDLKNVRLKLVAGLPAQLAPLFAKNLGLQQRYAAAEAAPAPAPSVSGETAGGTGELETMYIFELDGRKDLEMDKKIGLPLFEESAPIERLYTWDAYNSQSGPAVEEIRANNTMGAPWPAGGAMLYREGEFVSAISMPYTPNGTNASIVVGASPDLKVSKNLKDYNKTSRIREIQSSDNKNHTIKETSENWSYQLKVKSNLDRPAILEVSDFRPMEGKIVDISPGPVETTATLLKWRLLVEPRDKVAINYTYQVITTESLGLDKSANADLSALLEQASQLK